MGMHKHSCQTFPRTDPPLPAPNPSNFTVLRTKQVGKALIAKAHYPDATNYEGVKIMVYSDMDADTLRSLASLDPHFRPDGGPIARFQPTPRGWELAVLCAKLLND